MKGLYQDILLDHYKHPRNNGVIANADVVSAQYNPSCGDRVSVTAKIAPDGTILDVQFQATGCVISVATASLLSEKIKGLLVSDALRLDTQDMLDLIGMSLGPTRLKCALLPLYALRDGFNTYVAK